MAVAVEAISAAAAGKTASAATTSSVTSGQWTVIGLILVLLLLEAVIHPTIQNSITSIINIVHPKVTK